MENAGWMAGVMGSEGKVEVENEYLEDSGSGMRDTGRWSRRWSVLGGVVWRRVTRRGKGQDDVRMSGGGIGWISLELGMGRLE